MSTTQAVAPIESCIGHGLYMTYQFCADRQGITLAQYARNAVRAYGAYLEEHQKLPEYQITPTGEGGGTYITTRLTLAENEIIRGVTQEYSMSRSRALARALHYYHDKQTQRKPVHTQKKPAPQVRGPVKVTIPVHILAGHEKFLRTYAEHKGVDVSEVVVKALELMYGQIKSKE